MPLLGELDPYRDLVEALEAAAAAGPPAPPAAKPGTAAAPAADLPERPAPAGPSSAPLAAAVQAGLATERRLWPRPAHHDHGLAVVVAAARVPGLDAGMYLPHDGLLLPLGHGDLAVAVSGEHLDAAALLLVCGLPDRACRAAGVGGYTQMLVRAGAVGQAAQLEAASLGLAAATFGVSHPLVGRWLRRWSGGALVHLLTVAVGAGGSW